MLGRQWLKRTWNYRIDSRHLLRSLSFASKDTDPLILAIETSCDDTAVAIVSASGLLKSSVRQSQYKAHDQYRGIVPHVAQQSHAENLPLAIRHCLRTANASMQEITALAVTRGPGIALSLAVGYTAAKVLAAAHSLPLIAVHHMEAHLLMVRARMRNRHFSWETATVLSAEQREVDDEVRFPYLCLLLSGGHSQLILARRLGVYDILCDTLDKSIGSCIDQVARRLGIPYDTSSYLNKACGENVSKATLAAGAGPMLEHWATQGDANGLKLALPLQRADAANKICYTFTGCYSQLEQAIVRFERESLEAGQTLESIQFEDDHLPRIKQFRRDAAASFQKLLCDHVIERTWLALKQVRDVTPYVSESSSQGTNDTPTWVGKRISAQIRPLRTLDTQSVVNDAREQPVRTFAVSGGVASNAYIFGRLAAMCQQLEVDLVVPSPALCTDNAVMIAWAALEHICSDEGRGTIDAQKLSRYTSDSCYQQGYMPRWPLTELSETRV